MTLRSRGNALGGTLLVMVLLFIFGLTLANMATFDLRIVNRAGEHLAAREAAEAGLAHVIALVGKDPSVGTHDEVFTQILPDGSSYLISFDKDDANWSLNNLASLKGVTRGTDRTVPPSHCLIFSQGKSKAGEIALIESLIRLEALPYAIAGTGNVRGSNMIVAGSDTGANAGDRDLMGSTYSGIDTTFNGLGTINGKVRAVGTASVSGATAVAKGIESGVGIEQLPNLVISSFTTAGITGVDSRPGGLQVLPLTGPVYINGDANFLVAAVFVNATVFVNGDFNATAVAGTGTLFVTGETRIGPIALHLTGAGNRLTIFSEGDITISGLGIFQGVFLTHGNFTTTGLGALTVLGAIYANNPGAGNVALNGLASIVVHVEEYTKFASYWLALGGQAKPVQVYWNQLR